jgi:hypothetical protein
MGSSVGGRRASRVSERRGTRATDGRTDGRRRERDAFEEKKREGAANDERENGRTRRVSRAP